jgi:RNA polymerase sigma-70 factor (ECF subfamily)
MEAILSIGAPGEALREIAGDAKPSDFGEIYRRHGRALYGTALRMLRRPEDAEDAVQDAFLAYHRKRPDVPREQIGRWLSRVVINGCLDRLRRDKRWSSDPFDDTARSTRPPADDTAVDLARAVARLPEKARLVFLLHDVEGLKHRELAGLLELNVGTSKSQLFRARRMLRSFLEKGE